MPTQTFNINTDDAVVFANKLERLQKSALPVTVRMTLNDAAFDMKENTIKESANKQFTIRRPRFLSSHSRVNKSPNTFDINKMSSEAGIVEGKSIAGNRLEKQETGGTLQREAIPTAETRVSKDIAKKQRAVFFFRKFRREKKGHIPSQKGLRIKARKKRTFIKTDKAVLMVSKGGKWKTLFLFRDSVSLNKRSFVGPAGQMSAKKMGAFFIRNAKKRIEKILNQ